MVFGHTDGRYLDDTHFDPFWERAEALGVPVYLHAADAPSLPPSLAGRPELVGPAWSWTAEAATHALRLGFGGVFQRFPDVRLVLGHMGETLPFFLWRLDQVARAWSVGGEKLPPSQKIKRNIVLTTSGTFSDEPLRCALDAVGEDNVMFSVDDRSSGKRGWACSRDRRFIALCNGAQRTCVTRHCQWMVVGGWLRIA